MARSKAQGRKPKTKKKKQPQQHDPEENSDQTEDMPEEPAPSAAAEKFNAKDVLARAEEYFSNLDLDLAMTFCQKALSLSPDLEAGLILAGEICTEKGDMTQSIEFFKQAIEKYPNSNNFAKYLELAQILGGKESESNYLKGFAVMEKLMDSASGNHDLIKEASEVHCALGELYLTDLCDEEGAENQCELYFKKAHEIDESNPYALQGLANCYISSQKPDEAKDVLSKSLQLWLPQFSEALESAEASGDISEFECVLDFEKRKQCAQLLTELEKYEEAEKVLDTLAAEAEDSVEVWYMYGWVNYLRGSDFVEESKAYFNQVLEMSQNLAEDESLKEIRDHSSQLLKEMESTPMDMQ